MRKRETTFLDQYDPAVRTHGGSPQPPTYGHQYHYKVIEDSPSSQYHRILQCGGVLPMNTLNIETLWKSQLPANDLHKHKTSPSLDDEGPYYLPLGMFPIPPTVSDAVMASVVNEAIARAKEEAFDVLTFMAEFQKSVALVAGRMNSLFSIARRVAGRTVANRKRKKPRSLHSSIEDFASLWLEARYGWRPILYDIESILEAIKSDQMLRRIGRSSQNVTTNTSSTVTEDRGNSLRDVTTTQTCSQQVRGWALAEGELGGGILASPPLTYWETIPYSFVVDWFYQIGTFISALTPFPGVHLRASGCSIRTDFVYETSYIYKTKPDSSWTVQNASAGINRVEIQRYQRFPMNVSVPGWNPQLSSLKVIDIFSLVMSRNRAILKILKG